MTASDCLIAALNKIHATPEQRECAMFMLALYGIERAMRYIDTLELASCVGDLFEQATIVVIEAELPY